MYLYEKIAQNLKQDIENNKYKNSPLPSIRNLSLKLNCSPSSIIKAYELLVSNHIIYSIPQKGYFALNSCDNIKYCNIIDFSSGNIHIEDLCLLDLKHCLNHAVEIHKDISLDSQISGIFSLKKEIQKYLMDFNIFTKESSIFISQGMQQSLSILTSMPFPNGFKNILIEEPTYRFFIHYLKSFNIDTFCIKRDHLGIDLNVLEDFFKFKKIKFFFTIPRNHNPLGTNLLEHQKKDISFLAKKYNVFIVEDDYFSDFSKDSNTIYSYSQPNCIYIKSFSKVLPWLRIAFLVIPDSIIPTFKQYVKYSYYTSYFSASLVSQATLEIYLKNKLFQKQILAYEKSLSIKKQLLSKFLNKLKSKPIFSSGTSGIYSFFSLPEKLNEKKFHNILTQKNIIVSKGSSYFFNSPKKNFIRLSIAKNNFKSTELGLEIIYNALNEYF